MLDPSTPNRSVTAARRDLTYQARILPGVSRTFALTIPVLPDRLAEVVTNAYLLCRIADTIEDDTALTDGQKTEFHRRFLSVIKGREDSEAFGTSLAPLLSAQVLPDERDLVRNTASVVRSTHGFPEKERDALTRCLAIMCSGMPKFQRNRSLKGLRDLKELGAYCYVVAGVVGEMLTDLFCAHCPELVKNRGELKQLAVSFGQGLQMTNILKDAWEDRRSGTCWLPRSMFADRRFKLEHLDQFHGARAFQSGMNSLIAVTHRHLQECPGVHMSDSGARSRHAPVLPMGIGVGGDDLAEAVSESAFHFRGPGQGVPAHGPRDHAGYEPLAVEQPLSALVVQGSRQWTAAVASRYGDLDAHGGPGKPFGRSPPLTS